MNLVDRARFLDQIPNRRSNGIETVIRAAAQVKDHCVSVQGTGNLVLYSRYSPSLGGRTAHLRLHFWSHGRIELLLRSVILSRLQGFWGSPDALLQDSQVFLRRFESLQLKLQQEMM